MTEELRLDITLTPAQRQIYESPARFQICAAGRRFGKTHYAAFKLLENGLKNEHRGHPLTNEHEVYYVAPTFDQGKRNIWRKLKNIGKFVHEGGVIAEAHENTGVLTLVNGRLITIKGTDDPDKLRGQGIQYVVMDEFATMRGNVWDEIIEPSLIDVEGDAFFIGTPKGKNHFYELYDGAFNHSPGFEDWQAFHFTTLDNPTLADREKRRLFKNPRYSAELRRQELEADFITRGSGFLKEEMWQYSQVEPSDGFFVVVVDLAGFKPGAMTKTKSRDDETAISIVKIHRNGWWVKEIIHGQWDTHKTAVLIVNAARTSGAHAIGIEKTSLMYAVMPYLKEQMMRWGRPLDIRPLSHGNQRKEDRIMWALQGRLEKGRITLNADPSADFFERPEWIVRLIDQANDFPSPLAKDDLIDSLAYTDQMGATILMNNFGSVDDWEPLDPDAGY